MANLEEHSDPSLATSLGRVMEAGQRIVVNRIDLVRYDVLDAITRTLRGGAFVVIGGVILFVGWLALTGAAVAFASRFLTLPASAAVVGALNVAAGGILVVNGMRSTLPSDPPRSEASNGSHA